MPAQLYFCGKPKKGGKKIDIDVKVVAYGFPALCVTLGAALLLSNQTLKSSELGNWGGALIVIGAGLQALYLVLRHGHRFLG